MFVIWSWSRPTLCTNLPSRRNVRCGDPLPVASVPSGGVCHATVPPNSTTPAAIAPRRRATASTPGAPSPATVVPPTLAFFLMSELDTQSDADHAPLLIYAWVVHGVPVFDPVPRLIRRQEGAAGTARFRVVDIVRRGIDLVVRPETRLQIADVLRVEQIRALDVQRHVLPIHLEEALGLHRQGGGGREPLRVDEGGVLAPLGALLRRIRHAGSELVDERRGPVLLVPQP